MRRIDVLGSIPDVCAGDAAGEELGGWGRRWTRGIALRVARALCYAARDLD